MGDAGKVASRLVLMTHTEWAPGAARVVVLSPNAQKCYFCNPLSDPDFAVYMMPLGIPVEMLADREVTLDGVACRVKETADLLQWLGLGFELRFI